MVEDDRNNPNIGQGHSDSSEEPPDCSGNPRSDQGSEPVGHPNCQTAPVTSDLTRGLKASRLAAGLRRATCMARPPSISQDPDLRKYVLEKLPEVDRAEDEESRRKRRLLFIAIATAMVIIGLLPFAISWKKELVIKELVSSLVEIKAGKFTMGSPDGKTDERQHEVTLTRKFWLGKYEVTQAQYEAVMGRNPSYFRSFFWKRGDYPVECVSWEDAMKFCCRLTELERSAGRLPDGYVYTLPTEAEWEYACRAGTTGKYNLPSLDDAAWFEGNSVRSTHKVGTKAPNAWGLYDMHGNVWEWCWDWYGSYDGEAVDPVGPVYGSSRVSRGGGWDYYARDCRAASRNYGVPKLRSIHLGFRVALAPSSLRAELRQ